MRKQIALLVVLSILLAVCSVTASEEVRITFPRSVPGMSRHGNILVVIHYQSDERNRRLEVRWDSKSGDADAGGSVLEITSENDGIPVARDLDLSAGEYTFVATLYRTDDTKVVARQIRFVTQ